MGTEKRVFYIIEMGGAGGREIRGIETMSIICVSLKPSWVTLRETYLCEMGRSQFYDTCGTEKSVVLRRLRDILIYLINYLLNLSLEYISPFLFLFLTI